MMPELTLLLPASPPWGRRWTRAVAATVVHGIVLLLLFAPITFGWRSADRPPAPEPEKRVVWVQTAVPPVPPPQPAPQEQVTVAPKPIAYAAAPIDRSLAVATWREQLPRALALQAQGINAPSFVVENLDIGVITTLMSRNLVMLVAGRPPFDQRSRWIRTSGGGFVDAGAPPDGWAGRVARRTVVVPRSWVGDIPLSGDDEVYMFLTTNLDVAILAAQLAVAEERGVTLQALARTHGRLMTTVDGVMAFQIDTVDLTR